jgi:DNA-binding NarL/FixJ family response regulator
MAKHRIAPQTSVLLITHPGRIQDGLRALLRTIPEIGDIYQATDESSASVIIARDHPALVLMDSKCFTSDMASRVKSISPKARCILMIDNLQQQSIANGADVDTVMLSGFSAWEFLMTVENLLSEEIM